MVKMVETEQMVGEALALVSRWVSKICQKVPKKCKQNVSQGSGTGVKVGFSTF